MKTLQRPKFSKVEQIFHDFQAKFPELCTNLECFWNHLLYHEAILERNRMSTLIQMTTDGHVHWFTCRPAVQQKETCDYLMNNITQRRNKTEDVSPRRVSKSCYLLSLMDVSFFFCLQATPESAFVRDQTIIRQLHNQICYIWSITVINRLYRGKTISHNSVVHWDNSAIISDDFIIQITNGKETTPVVPVLRQLTPGR